MQGKNRGNNPGKPSGGSQETKVRGCFRCNYTDHKARDPNCPACNKKCNACGEIEHFAVCCKTKEQMPVCLSKLTFFGHDLSRQGVAPSEEKVAAILNANPLQDASQVRSFVQLVQYSAKFLPNFAQEAEPLMIRSLLRKNEPFIWGEAQERSFQKLKQLVAQATTLAYFRGDCNTRIIADAGPQGLGAVLTQLQDDEWRAIS